MEKIKVNNNVILQFIIGALTASVTFFCAYIIHRTYSQDGIIIRDRLYQRSIPLKVNQTGETLTGIEIDELLSGHGAAQEPWSDKRISVCTKLGGLCNKITFDANISDYERYAYTLLLGHTISKIESFGYPTLQETLSSVTIQKPKGGRRGYAGHDLIVFNIQNIKNFSEFYQVATHELGHILDLGVIQGTQSQKYNSDYTEFGDIMFYEDDQSLEYYKISRLNENTKKSDASFKDYVSGYGMSNPFEDFAESMNMYLNNNSLFVSMSSESVILKEKYLFMQRLFASNYTYNSLSGVKSIKQVNRRPRDSTRVSN